MRASVSSQFFSRTVCATVKTMIVTNAAGAINTAYRPGEITLLSDHILLFPVTPLKGANDERFGVRFPDMSTAYTPALRELARAAADEAGVKLNEGVYMYFPGPNYETPADIRAAEVLGADAVGMSTVPEATAAVHCGLRVMGIACMTNMAAGILDQALSHAEVLETSARVTADFMRLVKAIVKAM